MKYENSNRSISTGDLVRIRKYLSNGAYETKDGLYVVTGLVSDSDRVIVSKDDNGRVTGEEKICNHEELWLDQAYIGSYKNNYRDIRYGDKVRSTKLPLSGRVVGFKSSPFGFIQNRVIIANKHGSTTLLVDDVQFISRDDA